MKKSIIGCLFLLSALSSYTMDYEPLAEVVRPMVLSRRPMVLSQEKIPMIPVEENPLKLNQTHKRFLRHLVDHTRKEPKSPLLFYNPSLERVPTAVCVGGAASVVTGLGISFFVKSVLLGLIGAPFAFPIGCAATCCLPYSPLEKARIDMAELKVRWHNEGLLEEKNRCIQQGKEAGFVDFQLKDIYEAVDFIRGNPATKKRLGLEDTDTADIFPGRWQEIIAAIRQKDKEV